MTIPVDFEIILDMDNFDFNAIMGPNPDDVEEIADD